MKYMKKIFSLLFIATATMILGTSCENEVDDVFDKSSSLRIQEAMENYQKVLVSPANGWKMDYYGDTSYGGYTMFVKFNSDNTVTVANEVYGPGEQATSHYKLMQSAGVVLSFDEYNDIFHFFSDPHNVLGIGADGKGMEGDLEFRVLKATPDSVVMTGKKHGSKIVMTPFDGDWDKYMDDVYTSEADMAFGSYYYVVGNDSAVVTTNYRQLTFNYTDETGTSQTTKVGYIVRPGSLHLYEPVTIFGKTITDFDYKGGSDYKFTSNDTEAALYGYVMPAYEALLSSNWYICYANMSPAIQAYWDFAAPLLAENEYGEKLTYAYYSGTDLYIQSGVYWCGWLMSPQKISDDEVLYTISGWAGTSTQQGNASYYWNSRAADGTYYFRYFIYPLYGSVFKINLNDQRNPTEITLVSEDDPSMYFKVTKQAISASTGMK